MDSKSVFSEVNGKSLQSPPPISRSAITNFGGRRKKKEKNKQKRKQTNERQILQEKPP